MAIEEIKNIIDTVITRGFLRVRLFQDFDKIKVFALVGKEKHLINTIELEIAKVRNVLINSMSDASTSPSPGKIQHAHISNIHTEKFVVNGNLFSLFDRENEHSWIDLEFYRIRDLDDNDITNEVTRFDLLKDQKAIDLIKEVCKKEHFIFDVVCDDNAIRNNVAAFISGIYDTVVNPYMALATCIINEPNKSQISNLNPENITHSSTVENLKKDFLDDILRFEPDIMIFSLSDCSSVDAFDKNKFDKSICLYSQASYQRKNRKGDADLKFTIIPKYDPLKSELSFTVHYSSGDK